MPLILTALDDTLLDRSGAFRLWAKGFLEELGAPPDDLNWLLSVDADGLTPRWDLADLIRERYQLSNPSIDILDELREGPLAYEKLDPLVGCALQIAGDAGFVPVVVTNGPVAVEETRIRRTGLDQYVADWVISEQAGVSKPNPRIFAMAAQRVRMRLGGAWVVGDSPEADIGGAAAMGLPSVWLHRGRDWIDDRFAPTRVVGNVIQGLSAIMAAR
ncbi:HAD hydrolase-like protein [Actinoplanes sp. TBRC 11911]|uniref:HAD family hydrolase n=1 Tax=Actinoplanes sp. TBRC 11911 TaxID=2729386 RepID=UPI00145F4731|nr:HAD family hydrolase [Actinoplanes sp. TBRC 11911]NMO57094.1 HAD hydrolase-like protein [Actinoplanes sp. TBRC 11911]